MKESLKRELELANEKRADAMTPGRLTEDEKTVGLEAAIDNAQTGALALRDLISENRLPEELEKELRIYLAASLAFHEETLGVVTSSTRLLELYCDFFSGWAGAKLGQF